MMFALAMGIATANAQEKVTVGENNGSEEQPTLTKEVYPQKEADGDLYHGLTKKLTFDRMIPPHGLEVTYDKTVHVIFPAEVRYVDLGSPDLIAGKADGAENVIRVKATVRNFPNETNMSVITEDGSFYTFNVKYAAEPLLLNVEMCDFIHDGEKVNRPNNAQEIYLKELGSESPMLVRLIMKSIHKQNKREVKHIGCKRFGTKSSSGIRNLEYAFVMVEKGDDPNHKLMEEGVFRVFKDKDGLAANASHSFSFAPAKAPASETLSLWYDFIRDVK